MFVVKKDNSTEKYLEFWEEGMEYEDCDWTELENAFEFTTLEEAQDVADKINSGTVGMPRPK